MTLNPSAFRLSNVPYVNARFELKFLLEELETSVFVEALLAGKLTMPFCLYEGQPHELATELMRRTIVGLESYVVGAARITALNSGLLSEAFERKLSNP